MGERGRNAIKFILLLTLLFLLAYFVFYSPFFKVEIEFNGHPYVELYDVERYGGVKTGDNALFVSVEQMTYGLKKLPLVKDVTVTKAFPRTLHVDFAYREHFFNIKYSKLYLSVDDELIILGADEALNDGYLVEGFEISAFKVGETVKAKYIKTLRNTVDLIKLLSKSHVITQPRIVLREKDIVLYLDGSYTVNFGDGSDIERKFNDFVTIYDAHVEMGINEGIIDVSTGGFPTYKPFGEN